MMRKVAVLVLLVVAQLVIGKCCRAEPFLMQGSRAIAMGGAFVAIAEDAVAASWNPAGFAKQTTGCDFELPLAIRLTATGDIVKKLDDVAKIGYNDITNKAGTRSSGGGSLDTETVSKFFKLLDGIDDLNKEGMGLLFNLNAGLNMRIKNCGFSVVSHAMFSGDPNIDLQNISLGKSSGATGPSVEDAKDAIRALVGTETGLIKYADNSPEGGLAIMLVDLAKNITGTQTILGRSQAEALIERAYGAGLSFEDIQKYTKMVTEVAAKLGTGTLVAPSPWPAAAVKMSGTTSQSALAGNTSTLATKGAAITELMITYARPCLIEGLSVGLNLKYMQGIMAYYAPSVFKEDVEEEVSDILDKNTERSSSFGLDLGALYQWGSKTTLGLVIKNINSPSFAYPSVANLPDYKIKPQVRFGVACRPVRWINLALDSDLTKNETILDGFDSKVISAGAEINIVNRPIFNIALRCGVMKNMAEDDVGPILTGGLGINLINFHLDLTGLISSKKTQTEGGDEAPTAAGGSLQLALNF